MPRYANARPLAKSDPNELKVFRLLSRLSDEWCVVWGYYYTTPNGIVCEGDFLVLGPNGGLLVIEVKGRTWLQVTPDGRWSGDSDENPFYQLANQKSAVMQELNAFESEAPRLTVCSALGVPNIQRVTDSALPQVSANRAQILSLEDFQNFESCWDEIFGQPAFKGHYPCKESRERFLQSPWGLRLTTYGALLRDFLELQADSLTRARFDVLDHLPSYDRFAVTGVAGSGKTWLALELALRWAGREQGSPGRRVLLLCYNKPFEAYLGRLLTRVAGRSCPAAEAVERIDIRSWESLVGEMLVALGRSFDPPTESSAAKAYFNNELPEHLSVALEQGLITPTYDALVVDEAQDHDTQCGQVSNGWWALYRRLLKDPSKAPIAVCYDTGQRARFRPVESFDSKTLLAWLDLDQTAVRIHCRAPKRYTREIARFLEVLAPTVPIDFALPLSDRLLLPEGFPVEVYSAKDSELWSQLSTIVETWLRQGLVGPEEILIITARKSPSLESHLAGFALVPVETREPNQIAWVSAARCKALEATAVIVVGFRELEELDEGYRHSLFIAASRASQHLAMVTDVG